MFSAILLLVNKVNCEKHKKKTVVKTVNNLKNKAFEEPFFESSVLYTPDNVISCVIKVQNYKVFREIQYKNQFFLIFFTKKIFHLLCDKLIIFMKKMLDKPYVHVLSLKQKLKPKRERRY